MEKQYSPNQLLFKIKMAPLSLINASVALGEILPAGKGMSVSRPPQTLQGAKISAAALFLETILAKASIRCVKLTKKSIYYERIGGCRTIVSRNEKGIVMKGSDPSKYEYDILFAAILYELAYGTNLEFINAFQNAVTQCSTSHFVSQEYIGLFCDSYYYGSIRVGEKFAYDIVTEDVSEEAGKMRPKEHPQLKGVRQSSASAIDRYLVPSGKVPKREEPATTESKEDRQMRDADFVDRCLKGDFKIPYTWSEKAAGAIRTPRGFDDYVVTPQFVKLMRKIKFRTDRVLARIQELETEGKPYDPVTAIGQDALNINLVGEPGTGKTYMVYKAAEYTGLPVYTINCSKNMQEDDLGLKAVIVDGRPCMIPSDVLTCFEYGGICLLEEFNLAAAGVIMGALGQAVEYPFVMKTEGNRTIQRHPLCIFIGCMNTGTAGSQTPSEAYTNRFPIVFRMMSPTKDDFIAMLMASTGEDRKVCRWVYEAYEKILNYLEEERAAADIEGIKLTLSLRSCKGAVQNIQEGWDPKDAIRDSIIGKIAERDSEVADRCEKTLMEIVRDPEF